MNRTIGRSVFAVLLVVCMLLGSLVGSASVVVGGEAAKASMIEAFQVSIAEAANVSTPTTNQEKVFTYLTSTLDLNTAAACGIMANIERESSFNPSATGGGGKYYGICQWGNSRKTALIVYCKSKGLDYTTLEGQLAYLKHELTNSYGKVYAYMQSVANTPQGAYDAGYYWCYHFERPANIESTSTKRGELSRDKYWPIYSEYQVLPFVSYIDSPVSETTYNGVVSLRGWALYGDGVTKVVANVNGNEVSCEFVKRGDVQEAYPEYEEENAGFFGYIPASYLYEGENVVRLTAYCEEQEFAIGEVTFVCENVDRNAPLITEVSVTDVTEYGYTVTCRVQDENGLLRVQFPTWTEVNGQDDLNAGWRTLEKYSGTIDGEMVTYRVPVRGHNYESGKYITHIYAYDLAGNQSMSGISCQVPEGALVYGDVITDKHIDATDALATLKAVVKLETLDETQQKKADVDGNAFVEAIDALMILQRTVKIIEVFPAEGQ